jgi:FADH2 O2-dependent halogenase
MTRDRTQVAVVGSGFAGALLARLLARQGLDVTLIERGRHPRFAIGESSTPLANLSLERLAHRYGERDLWNLASHGRWVEHFPELRQGLKRGFTFYRHRPGRIFENGAQNRARLLVAASPTDRVADTHWLRADVDHHFVRQAQEAGVDYRDETQVREVALGSTVRIRTEKAGEIRDVRADMIVDATGPGGLLRRTVPIPSRLAATATRSLLLYGHFSGVRRFADVSARAGGRLPRGPYPEDWAAVHHVVDEGWIYVLRFDDGLVSAGLLATPAGARRLGLGPGADPTLAWSRLLGRYPSLGAQFRGARPLFPVRFAGLVQHRLARAAGTRWVLLPHTYAFVDPLFSTGIAWSLLAVERLAELLGEARRRGVPGAPGLRRYGTLLAAEADQIDRLVAGAYAAMPDFSLFVAHSMLYFAVVSYGEARQRLVGGSAWDPFLGATEREVEGAYRTALAKLRGLTGGKRRASAGERRAFAEWVASAIASRNVAGLADPRRRNLYPVDLDVLVERCALLGLTRGQIEAALPRLRG